MVGRRVAFLISTMSLLACGSSETDNPFASGGGGGLPVSSSDDGTTASSADGSSSSDSTEGSGGPTGDSDTELPTAESGDTGSLGTSTTDTASGEASSTGDAIGLPFTLDEVIWLYPDITDWPETVTLSSITLEGEFLCLNHDIASQEPAWPIVLSFGTTEVVGNAWVFIEQGGQWYAATWEWLRPPGQTCKYASAVEGGHIKVDPFGENSGWVPTSGQSYYFMVSGLIRNPSYSNVLERSNIVEYVWP